MAGAYQLMVEELKKVELCISLGNTEVMTTSEQARGKMWKVFTFDNKKNQVRQPGVDIL